MRPIGSLGLIGSPLPMELWCEICTLWFPFLMSPPYNRSIGFHRWFSAYSDISLAAEEIGFRAELYWIMWYTIPCEQCSKPFDNPCWSMWIPTADWDNPWHIKSSTSHIDWLLIYAIVSPLSPTKSHFYFIFSLDGQRPIHSHHIQKNQGASGAPGHAAEPDGWPETLAPHRADQRLYHRGRTWWSISTHTIRHIFLISLCVYVYIYIYRYKS